MCLYRTKKKSTNILGVSVLGAGPVGTQSASRPVETRRNPFRLTRLNPSKHVQTCYVSSRPNELFSIFLFLFYKNQIYTSSPLLLLLPQFPPFIPIFFFCFFWGGGGGERERAGDGDGTGGEPPPPPPAGRSPLRRGGDKVPPPFSIKQKKNKIYKSNDISTLDNNIL